MFWQTGSLGMGTTRGGGGGVSRAGQTKWGLRCGSGKKVFFIAAHTRTGHIYESPRPYSYIL